MKKISNILWVSAGTLCLVLGVLGAFLPVLPTTVFLLMAAYCYGRGSKRFHHWLIHSSWLGSYIRNYQSGRGIPLKQKVITIAFLWLTIGASIVLVDLAWWVDVLLFGVAVGVTIHIVKIKTYRPQSATHEEEMKPSATDSSFNSLDPGLPASFQSNENTSGE